MAGRRRPCGESRLISIPVRFFQKFAGEMRSMFRCLPMREGQAFPVFARALRGIISPSVPERRNRAAHQQRYWGDEAQ